MSKYSSFKEHKRALIIIILSAIALFSIIMYFGWPYVYIFNNPEKTRELIVSAGPWGPLIYILMQLLQIIIAPIPGQVIGFIGGYLFGPVWGVIYTLIGATIGFTIVFILARKLGRPFVELFVNKKVLDKFDHLANEKGVLIFFFIFLLPAFPDDIISFIAGLTTIRIPTLVIISLLGRLPGYIVLSFTGNGFVENFNIFIVNIVVMLILFAIGWWKRAWIYEFVHHSNRILFIKDHWEASWRRIIIWAVGIIVVALLLYNIPIIMPT